MWHAHYQETPPLAIVPNPQIWEQDFRGGCELVTLSGTLCSQQRRDQAPQPGRVTLEIRLFPGQRRPAACRERRAVTRMECLHRVIDAGLVVGPTWVHREP